MSAVFTPGPWRIDRHLEMLVDSRGAPISGKANYLLCAAAPDLYAALADARKAIDSLHDVELGFVEIEPTHEGGPAGQYPIRNELLDKISAALAKARGEA
jgi:hypothetical protein